MSAVAASAVAASVVVRGGGSLWRCMLAHYRHTSGFTWKCGRCTRGVVLQVKGSKCKLCGARVVEVVYR